VSAVVYRQVGTAGAAVVSGGRTLPVRRAADNSPSRRPTVTFPAAADSPTRRRAAADPQRRLRCLPPPPPPPRGFYWLQQQHQQLMMARVRRGS